MAALGEDVYRRVQWDPLDASHDANPLAVILRTLLRRLRTEAFDWLVAPAQRSLLRNEPMYVQTFPMFAAEHLRSAPESLRSCLWREAAAQLAHKPAAQRKALAFRLERRWMDGEVAQFMLAECAVLKSGQAPLGSRTNEHEALASAPQRYGYASLRDAYEQMEEVCEEDRACEVRPLVEHRFNYANLARHHNPQAWADDPQVRPSDRMWGGDVQIRAIAECFGMDVAVLDESAPSDRVMYYECGSRKAGVSESWDAIIAPRLVRMRQGDLRRQPQEGERSVPLAILHWTMSRAHYEPALPIP